MSSSDNKVLFGLFIVIIVFLVFIGPKFPDRLPDPLLKLFLNPYFRAFIVFISIYSIQFNIYFSIIITLIFFIMMNKIENSFLFELFLSGYQKHVDHFIDMEQNSETDSNIYQDNVDKADKCSKYVKDEFPCNNLNKNGSCCENVNFDQYVRDDNGNSKNVTLFMNKEIDNSKESQDISGINNINTWCQNYIDDSSPNKVDVGCKNKKLLERCRKINKICDPKKWVPTTSKKQDELTGTCGAPCSNIHNQVCFDIKPNSNKCKNFNKQECIKNKKDCFYIENNQFINSKVETSNATYRCKIPKKNEDLPKNCFPVKLYKDSCGNVGMGCWVKEDDIESPPIQESETSLQSKPMRIVYPRNKDDKVFHNIPSVTYRTADNVGDITNKTCQY